MNVTPDIAERMFAEVNLKIEETQSGGLVLMNGIDLDARDETLLDVLEKQALEKPATDFLKQRKGDGWESVTYSRFLEQARRRARQLLAGTLATPDHPLLILAPNSIDHAITAFAAMLVGIPISPVSPAYGLNPAAYQRLSDILKVLQPGAVYVGDPRAFEGAIPLLTEACPGQVYSATGGPAVRTIDDLEEIDPQAYQQARALVSASSIAKILFTSGSTGMPKGVINTHRMLCSNQRALAQLWPFLKERPSVLLDWLPWSHTFGGNVCFNATLFHGGTLHIDSGKPAPGLIEQTIENLRDVAPSIHFNVPAGIEALLPFLERDSELAAHFFSNLDAVFVAAAALPQRTRDRLKAVGKSATGHDTVLLAGWGSTETAPFSTCVYYPTDRADTIGLPMPGTSIKLTPNQDKLALSVSGPNVTPGYWNNDEATKAAFDAAGFYQMGDAGRFSDPEDPQAGLSFDGRLSENFKLTSGTWVNVGMLRVKLLGRLAPDVIDLVLTGHNESEVGALLVPNLAQAHLRYNLKEDADVAELMQTKAFRDRLTQTIAAHNKENKGGSTAVKRVALLSRAPDIGRGEITDKGYINQRAMLSNWSELVAALHSDDDALDLQNLIIRLD